MRTDSADVIQPLEGGQKIACLEIRDEPAGQTVIETDLRLFQLLSLVLLPILTNFIIARGVDAYFGLTSRVLRIERVREPWMDVPKLHQAVPDCWPVPQV